MEEIIIRPVKLGRFGAMKGNIIRPVELGRTKL